MLHLPAAAVSVQLTVPSDAVTFPVGVPPTEVTLNATVIGWPSVEGCGVTLRMVVVVAAWVTVCPTPSDVLPAKSPSPAYVAVRVFAPAVVGVSVQPPAATVPEHCSVPSLTVTFPLGAPALEVTRTVTAIGWATVD